VSHTYGTYCPRGLISQKAAAFYYVFMEAQKRNMDEHDEKSDVSLKGAWL